MRKIKFIGKRIDKGEFLDSVRAELKRRMG